MNEYRKLELKRFAQPELQQRSAETRYWKKFKTKVHVKEVGGINSIEFSPVAPYDFCLTAGARIQIYSCKSNSLKKSISRFKESTYCSSFRNDGKVLVAGDASGLVQVFDLSSRAILRHFKGHKDAVRSARFLGSSGHILSTSDDHSVRLWDIPSNSAVKSWENVHNDYVRCSAVSRTNNNLAITGSYDHTLKVWDFRTKDPVMSITHFEDSGRSLPVESVLLYPGDTMAISAAGNQIKVWDLLGSIKGKPIYSISNHQKTITSMCFNSQFTRLLTASLDHQVKIYDMEDYTVAHSIRYPGPLISVGISPNDTHLVTAMSNGLLTVRERQLDFNLDENSTIIGKKKPSPYIFGNDKSLTSGSRRERDAVVRAGSSAFFMRGQYSLPNSGDLVVDHGKKPKLKSFEKLLKKFDYAGSLDVAFSSNMPSVTIITLLDELKQRGDGLKVAFSGRDDESLEGILHFIMRNITNPRYMKLLSDCTDLLIDMYQYEVHLSPIIQDLFKKIRRKIRDEMRISRDLAKLAGSLNMIMEFNQTSFRQTQNDI